MSTGAREPLSQRGLERRLKRHFLKAQHEFFVPCALTVEHILENEIKRLPFAKVMQIEKGGVGFKASLDAMYFANLWLRTAHRVLLRVDSFLAQSYPMLFDHARKIPWEQYLGFNQSYSLRVSSKNSRLLQHKTVAKVLHDAVLARLEPLGLAPKQTDDAPLEFYLRLFQDRCTISFNSSGEHLHKRGYRSFVSKAPLRETLAAALLLSARAKPFETVIDPMCGSGTLLIEEALLAKKQAPGLVRPFAFEHLPAFHASKWERFKTEASTQALELNKRLIGMDIESKNIESARTNATRAGIKTIQFLQADALSTVIEALNPESTLLVSNLPYGERLNTDTRALLAEFAIHLNQNYQGCSFAFIAKDKAWLESTHFELAACQHFQNGGLDVFLLMGKIKGRGLQP